MIEANGNPNFLVSDLTLAETITVLGFDFTKFIPKGGRVLNCGSGIYRKFERELLEVIPHLSLISIDPSLGVVTINHDGSRTSQGYQIYVNVPHGVVYEPLDKSRSKHIIRGEQAVKFDMERKGVVTQIPGAVAADGINLPFKDHLFDTIIDVRGPILYLKHNYQIMKKYFSELKRTLKNDGFIVCIHMDPIQREVIINLQMRVIQQTKDAWLITK
ncbi:hypothetical protein A2363_02450 [Candidatus Gottesmanbacteria bacterium RIFOXYB1_FULL_47_11]|uniref:Methyltransferase type 11 domain-containing protein n=1 Tax=Candidatus Gottesmanbacteria bacterium RIFOXYB1_FULL_47_11 TaxID=1798401 RepID=A0A1F6BEM7_9BACT|nr:MAG: hypothetical protein A2363_02450 [Candidatus Gottesmanbacteria bacterium RIFOXYB1_FULL_47_11]